MRSWLAGRSRRGSSWCFCRRSLSASHSFCSARRQSRTIGFEGFFRRSGPLLKNMREAVTIFAPPSAPQARAQSGASEGSLQPDSWPICHRAERTSCAGPDDARRRHRVTYRFLMWGKNQRVGGFGCRRGPRSGAVARTDVKSNKESSSGLRHPMTLTPHRLNPINRRGVLHNRWSRVPRGPAVNVPFHSSSARIVRGADRACSPGRAATSLGWLAHGTI